MKKILLPLLLITGFYSCTDYSQEVYPVIGFYDARVVGVTGTFEMNISADWGRRVLIDAPFDGDVWDVVEARIDEPDSDYAQDIDIPHQTLADGVEIWGDGVYYNGTIQLDYKMRIYGDKIAFKIIGSQY